MGYSGDGGAATSAMLFYPSGVTVDAAGDVYIADTYNCRVRMVGASSPRAFIYTPNPGAFGSDSFQFAVNDGTQDSNHATISVSIVPTLQDRTAAMDEDTPANITLEPTDAHGLELAFAILTPPGHGVLSGTPPAVTYTPDADYNGTDSFTYTVAAGGVVSNSATVTITVNPVYDLPVAHNGTLETNQNYPVQGVLEAYNDTSHPILYFSIVADAQRGHVVLNPAIGTLAGTGTPGYDGDNGAATAAKLYSPQGVAIDVAGNVYIADQSTNRIRKVDTSGTITTLAGTGTGGFSGDDGPASSAQLNKPFSVAADAAGNIYIADQWNHRIRKVSPEGTITTLAGDGTAGYSADGGEAVSAQLNYPAGVAVDAAGNVYIADTSNNRLRKVSTEGIITTLAGTGTGGFSGDGGAAVSAQLYGPYGVTVDAAGNVYIAENYNHRIRKVSTEGIITTLAGDGTGGYSGDGGGAASARLSSPQGVAVDAAGNVYIADRNNARIRKIGVDGTITTIAGTGTAGYSGDGGLATAARLNYPAGVAVDAAGNVYIADTSNYRIRKITAGSGGVFTYTPNLNETGTDTFTFTVYDGVQVSDTATITVTINPFNTAPVASDQTLSIDEDTPTVITLGATDLNVDPLSFAVATGPAHGSLSGTLPGVTYTPDLNYYGTDAFTFYAYDGSAYSNLATISLAIASVNDAPAAFNGVLTTDVNVAARGWLAASDPEADPLTFSIISNGSRGTAELSQGGGIITTHAGNGVYGYSGDGGAATSAQLYLPAGVAVDAAGNVYIADSYNHRVRKVSPTGAITTLAGTGTSGYSGDDGSATAAKLYYPSGVAVDAAGNAYIADKNNHRIRKVSPAGIITTIAGTGTGGYSGDGGAATLAQLYYPRGVEIDAAGNVYIADKSNNRVRKVDPWGTITTLAGTGTAGYSGDGGPATSAQLYEPQGVAVDAAGNVYIADSDNHRIRQVSPWGTITTLAGTGTAGYSGDGGPATSAQLYSPQGVAIDAAGNVYIAEQFYDCIRKVNSAGAITTISGTGTGGYSGDGGAATSAALNAPGGVAVDSAFNLYIADTSNHRVRKITAEGAVFTYTPNSDETGTDTFTFRVSDGTSDSDIATVTVTINPASNQAPDASGQSVATAEDTAVEITLAASDPDEDPLTYEVAGGPEHGRLSGTAPNLTYTPDESYAGQDGFTFRAWDGYAYSGIAVVTITVSPVPDVPMAFDGAATASLEQPVYGRLPATDGDGDPLSYVIVDNGTKGVAVILGQNDAIVTTAGTGTGGYSGDGGPATSAALYDPGGVAVDAAGNVYIADDSNHRIRKIDTMGTITTMAGTGTAGYSGDGGVATSAKLYHPTGVAVDAAGNVYIADKDNHRVRKVSAEGIITTLAGTGTYGYSGDGGAATLARLNSPRGVAVDAAGNVYIADYSNHRVRKVDPSGMITTLAGTGTGGYSGDGGPPASAKIYNPTGVAVDAAGNLYIADFYNNCVRKVAVFGMITTLAGTGTGGYSGDGGPATSARLQNPMGVAVDAAGNVYIADKGNHRVRKVDTWGIITTIAGTTYGYSGDGGPAISAQLNNPGGVAVDAAGYVYIADCNNHRVRRVEPPRGVYVYTPNEGASGADTFTFKANDGTAASNTATIFVTIGPINNAPVITSDGGGETASVSMAENQTYVTTVTGADADDDTVTYAITGGSDREKFAIDAESGALSFAIAPDFEQPEDSDGNNTYIVEVTATDNGAGPLTDVQTITVTVTDVNESDPPTGAVAINGGRAYTQSAEVSLHLSATDDVGVTGYYLSTAGSPVPSAAGDGWVPVPSTESFAADVSYSLTGADGPKTVYAWYKDGEGNVSETASASIVLAVTDTDGDGLPDLWETAYGLDPNDPSGINGQDGDPNGDGVTNLAHFQAETSPTDHPPAAVADRYDVDLGQTIEAAAGKGVLANDTDAEAQTLTAELWSDPAHGTLTLNADGSFTYQHDGTLSGDDAFSYRAWDGHYYSEPATVTLTLHTESEADRDLSVSPVSARFGVALIGGGTMLVALTVTNSGSSSRTLGSLGFDGPNADQFAFEPGMDGCSDATLPPGGTCTVQVVFNPTSTGSKSSLLLIPSDDPETPTLVAFLSNHEGKSEEACRRLPPVLAAITMADPMHAGTTYQIEWTVLGYAERYQSYIAMFDCTGMADDACGSSYGGSERFEASGALDPVVTEQGNWTYGDLTTGAFTYRYTFTPDPERFTEEETPIVVRFYVKSAGETVAGQGSISLLVPGNLAGGYYDSSGRRIVNTIVNP